MLSSILKKAVMVIGLAAGSLFGLGALASNPAEAACVRGVPPGDVLWIRSGPGTNFTRVGSFARKECGIHIFWNSCQGPWCRAAKGGREGWVHTSYLNNAGGPGGGGGWQGPGNGLCANSCQQLWVMRNQVYKNKGYCFKTKRARNYFGNAGCYIYNQGAVPLSQWERNHIERIRQCEQNKGC